MSTVSKLEFSVGVFVNNVVVVEEDGLSSSVSVPCAFRISNDIGTVRFCMNVQEYWGGCCDDVGKASPPEIVVTTTTIQTDSMTDNNDDNTTPSWMDR